MNELNSSERSNGRSRRTGRALLAAVCGCAIALGMLAARAQTGGQQSMEERLRAQLRATTTQLQQAQAELARLKSGTPVPAAPAAIAASEGLQKELAQTKAQLTAERARARRLEAGQIEARREIADEQSAQLRDANAQLQKAAETAENERRRLANEAVNKGSALQQCEAKNAKLYALGQEVLHAYETVDFGTVFSTRQPFASKARAKYGQIAQDYGDRLYQGRFGPAATETPAAVDSAPKPR